MSIPGSDLGVTQDRYWREFIECVDGGRVEGFRLKIDQSSTDSSGVTGIQFKCTGRVSGITDKTKMLQHIFGYWREFTTCRYGHYVVAVDVRGYWAPSPGDNYGMYDWLRASI